MVPPNPPAPGPGSQAERLLWEELKEGLPESYFVYYSLRYFDEGRAREGEADFVILHRERGMLVVECTPLLPPLPSAITRYSVMLPKWAAGCT